MALTVIRHLLVRLCACPLVRLSVIRAYGYPSSLPLATSGLAVDRLVRSAKMTVPKTRRLSAACGAGSGWTLAT